MLKKYKNVIKMFLFIGTTAGSLYSNSVYLKNDTNIPMAAKACLGPSCYSIILEPQEEKQIADNHTFLNSIHYTPIFATTNRENPPYNHWSRTNAVHDIDINQHRATYDPDAKIVYAIKSGWTQYYIHLIPQ